MRLGHLIAPTGVRYIAFLTRAAPDAGARGRPIRARRVAAHRSSTSRSPASSRARSSTRTRRGSPGRATCRPTPRSPADSDDPLARQRTVASRATPVHGPRVGLRPAGPGTLLWAEAANSGWRGDGRRRARCRDATRSAGRMRSSSMRAARVDLSFSGGPRRLLHHGASCCCWMARCVVVLVAHAVADAEPMTGAGMRTR